MLPNHVPLISFMLVTPAEIEPKQGEIFGVRVVVWFRVIQLAAACGSSQGVMLEVVGRYHRFALTRLAIPILRDCCQRRFEKHTTTGCAVVENGQRSFSIGL